jgi:YD repeat-containing protein
MVAIVTGKGVGLERSSAWVLGSEGQLGSAAQGRGGDNVFVNGANGNLVITRKDEFLIGRGPDVSIDRTYNSQTVAGVTDGDNNDQWRMGVYRRITGIPGSYGSAYSTVKRIDWDGSDTVYTWDSTRSAYIGKEGAGAYDKLTRAGTTWTWTDGDTQVTELYDQNLSGRLTSTTDQDGNSLAYAYNANGQITRVTSTNGSQPDEYTDLVYSGTLLTQITTSTASGQTRVFYEYDTAGRLWKVKVNLDPTDNSPSIGANYVTTYTYSDSTSKRVTKIQQSDGSELAIAYTLLSGLYKVTSLTQTVASGVTRTTSITYSTNKATVVDAAGNTTVFNTQYPGDLAKIEQGTSYGAYSYNGNGDLSFVDLGPTTSAFYDYDGNGNRITEVNRSGDTITRTYSAKNELLTETRYATPDPDGSWGSGQPGSPMTTRYAYDDHGHLRYMVSAEGEVTEYVTQLSEASLGYGQRIATIAYAANSYDVSGLAPNACIATGTLDGWAATVDKSAARRTETSYDFRGNVTAVKSQEKLLGSGQFDPGSALSHTVYVYDQAGNLLSRQDPVSSASELFVYDGLNRLIVSTDFNNVTTSTVFYDSTSTTVVNYANNLVATSLYNLAGDLITYTESGPSVTSAATNYRYDGLGRLRVTIDPLGQRDYLYYDQVGRKIGEIDSDGSVTEYRYDGNGNLASTTQYVTRLDGNALALLADANGNPTSATFASVRPSANGGDRWTWHEYDMSQRLVRSVDGTGAVTGYTYDAASRLLSTIRYSTLLSSTTLANMKVQNLWANSGDGSQWQAPGLSVVQSGTIAGANAYKFTTTASSGYEAVVGAPTVVGAGETLTFTIWVKGVGSTTTAEIGILGSATGWGAEGDATAYVIDASYSAWAEVVSGGRYRINGLSATTAVPVIYTRTFNLAETATSVFYVQDSGQQVPAGRAAILAAPLVTLSAGPAETSSDDRMTRNFYDADDRLIATLDGDGYLTETFYDEAGYKARTIAYANATEPDDRAGGTLQVLRDGIAIDNARDIRNYFVHDARGLLRATVDGEGDLTRYRYTPLGDVDQIVTGQKLDPAALLATPPTFATLPAAPSGAVLQTVSYTRNLYGQALTETKSLTGGTSTVNAYAYDTMGRLVSATTQSGGADPRISSQRYDARGRLKGELSGIGSALLAALGPDPDPEQADPIWAEYGTLYGYDDADRLIATSDPAGARTLFYYDADDRLAYQVNGLGEVVEYRYDAFGGRTDTFLYAGRIDAETFGEMTGGRASDVAATIAALADVSVDSRLFNSYDNAGRLTMANDLLGSYTLYAYNSFGEVKRRNTAFGESPVTPGLATEIQTDFEYDRRGLLRSQLVDTAEGGHALWTSFGFDAFGREVVLTDAALNSTVKTYDRAGRVTQITDALNHSTLFTYDARGNLVAVRDALNNITRYVYDNGGRRIFAVDALGGLVSTTYDDDGRVLAVRVHRGPVPLAGLGLEVAASDILFSYAADDRITRNAYDKDGRLRFVVEGSSLAELRYDDAGKAIRTIRYGWPVSAASTYTIDDLQAQVDAHDAVGDPKRVTRAVYDAAGRLAFAIDAAGSVTAISYDSAGRTIKQVALATAYVEDGDPAEGMLQLWAADNAHADDRASRAIYDRKGRLVYSIDAKGFVTEYRHTRTGEVTAQIRYADSYAIGDGATQASVAALLPGLGQGALVSEFHYDSAGRLYETRDPAGNLTSMTLDALGQITASTFTAWGTWETTTTLRSYDALGRIESETRAVGAAEEITTAYDHDALGQLIATTYASGTPDACTTTRSYDELGRLETETRADGHPEEVTTAYTYTRFGDVESIALAAGTPDESVTMRYYDVHGRVEHEMRAYWSDHWTNTVYAYNSFGEVQSVAEAAYLPDQSVTTRTYDARGNLESETRADGTGDAVTSRFTYDSFGELESVTRADGTTDASVTSRIYDALGRVVSVRQQVDDDPDHDLVTANQYDGFGNLVKVTDPRLNSSYFYYDELGRVELQVDPEGYATRTSYDAVGGGRGEVTRYATKLSGPFSVAVRPDPPTHAKDATTHFEYDELGRLTGMTDAENHGESYDLDIHGNRIKLTNKLGGETDYTYDKLGRMKTQFVHALVHDAEGVELATGVRTDFDYDKRGNLVTTTEGANLASWDARTITYKYDQLDRLIEIDREDIASLKGLTVNINLTMKDNFVYDRRGNLIEERLAGGLTRTLFYYDKLDRRTLSIGPVGLLTAWDYDANGNAVGERVYGDLVVVPVVPWAAPPDPVDLANFRETRFSYDKANRLETTRGPVLTTGRWDGASYVFETGEIVRQVDYDAAGNVIRESVGDVESRSFYDKAGGKIGQLDAEGYLTVWDRDAEGNVLVETRYAARPAGAIAQEVTAAQLHAAAQAGGDNRVTEFSYDRNGRRKTETRRDVVASTVTGTGGVLAPDTDPNHVHSTISYDYNGFGEVVRKTEANGDDTVFDYDDQGRLVRTVGESYADDEGATVTPITENLYDGFGGIVRTVENPAAAEARVTRTFYNSMGWATLVIDAEGGAHSYVYNGAGKVVADKYSRTKSNLSIVNEAISYGYDVYGRLTSQSVATRVTGGPNPTYSGGDRTQFKYNIYGDMIGRGVNTDSTGNAAYQETFDYDAGGRLWRSTAGDGTAKIMVYDALGNATLTISSAGANLATLAPAGSPDPYADTLAGLAIDADGDTDLADVVTTIAVFDKRGQQTATIEPDRQLSTAAGTVTITRGRAYNAFGEMTSETDARNNTTDLYYNKMGRLIRKESPAVSWTEENGAQANARPTEHYFYDVSGRLVAVTDANTHTTRRNLLAGTGHGGTEALVTAEFHADDRKTQTLYDVFGDARIKRNEYWIDGGVNDTSKTDMLFEYDRLGRVVKVEHLGRLLTETFAYDQLGQRTRHSMMNLTETTDYDRQGRVFTQVAFGGDTTIYTYSWNGALATGTLGTFGGWVKTTINAATRDASETLDYFGRMIARSDFGDNAYSYGFDLAGRVTSQAASGETLTYSYLNTGRISLVSNGAGSSTAYGYDAAGNETSEMTIRNGQTVQNATAGYDALGRMTNWAEAGGATLPAASILYEYDRVGNIRRQKSSFQRLDGFGQPMGFLPTQDNWYRYDVMNRVTTDRGFLVAVVGSEVKTGDDARGIGTIRRQLPGILTSLNRLGEVGYDYAYDETGRRVSMAMTKVRYEGGFPQNAYFREHKEMYDYFADGSLSRVRQADGAEAGPANFMTVSVPAASGTGTLLSEFTRDALGRVTSQTDWMTPGVRGYSRTGIIYNDKGQITDETVSTLAAEGNANVLYVNVIQNSYGAGADYALGAVTGSTSTVQRSNSPHSTATTTNTYNWRDAPVNASTLIHTERQFGATTDYTTTYNYGASSELASVNIQDGRPRDVYFTNDMAGQVIRRDETGGNSSGAPHEIWYRFGGRQMGFISNNGTLDNDYNQSLVYRQVWLGDSEGLGPFRLGGNVPKTYADFSQSLDPINSYAQGGAGGGYVVRAGDTLQSIASSVWGDADLWYKLAEANGLSGNSVLVEGRSLTIPGGVVSNAHNDGTFRPYDAAKALGDLSPGAAKPPAKPGGCGMIGQLLVMAIAVAITLIIKVPVAQFITAALKTAVGVGSALVGAVGAVAGAAVTGVVASAASQGIGVATGLTDKFSWKGVAMAGISAGVTQGFAQAAGSIASAARAAAAANSATTISSAGRVASYLAGGSLGAQVVRGVVTDVASQGIAVATGLQKKLDWAGVAAGAAGAGIGALAGQRLEGLGVNGLQGPILSGIAGGIASAGTRSVLTGTSFGDNIIAVLPSVIANTIGMVMEDALSRRHARVASTNPEAAAAPAPGSAAEGNNEIVVNTTALDDALARAFGIEPVVQEIPEGSVTLALTPSLVAMTPIEASLRTTRSANPATQDEALEYLAETVDILTSSPPHINDPDILAGNMVAVALMDQGSTFEEYVPVIARGTEAFITAWGGSDALAQALAARAGEGNYVKVKRFLYVLGLEMTDGGDFILQSAPSLVYNYAYHAKGRVEAIGAGMEFLADRALVNRVTDTYAGPVGSATDAIDGANSAFYDSDHIRLHVLQGRNGRNPIASGLTIEMGGGHTGDWPAELNTSSFHPNSTYVVNGYTYRTDSEGRVISVEGTLSSQRADRNGYQQRKIGRSSGVEGDQGGHLIASIFNGPGDRLNIVPMDGNLNMGRWRSMERSWAEAQKAGQTVSVNMEAVYRGNSTRPTSFNVIYHIDGVAGRQSFRNGR